ncbi:MAG: PQQ-dependent sugar dehydrogenase [Gemmatimonadaceae bacterium]|nr:PQQ-dependent sugar dehydrogenase [Gemmatimonadaceae bacterium]MBX9856233.1 PQQ-dependent sugar dehydrogenase [Gemmatimonadaceae bacterium]
MMRGSVLRLGFVAAGVVLGSAVVTSAAAAQATPAVFKSSVHDYRVVPVVDGFVNPWGLAFLPGGDLLVTERPGRLRLVRGGKLLPTPVTGVPAVVAAGQGGLLDVVVHPNFAQNRYVYLTYSKQVNGGSTTALHRAKLVNDALVEGQDIFVADTRGRPGHFGSRIAFDGKGHLFMTVGDRQAPPEGDLPAHPAQDLSTHQGKVLRLMEDGTVPKDNPFVGRSGAKPEIWSYGHRNPQGLVVHPTTGAVWATEHGPQGGDELNLVEAGKNYGWPVVGFGVNYGPGKAIHASTMAPGMENAKHVWVPSIATSGLMVYTGDKFPAWKGSVFAGGLAGQRVARLTLDGARADLADNLARNLGRVRDVRQGPDGFVYVVLDDQQGKPTGIVRLEPVARR